MRDDLIHVTLRPGLTYRYPIHERRISRVAVDSVDVDRAWSLLNAEIRNENSQVAAPWHVCVNVDGERLKIQMWYGNQHRHRLSPPWFHCEVFFRCDERLLETWPSIRTVNHRYRKDVMEGIRLMRACAFASFENWRLANSEKGL